MFNVGCGGCCCCGGGGASDTIQEEYDGGEEQELSHDCAVRCCIFSTRNLLELTLQCRVWRLLLRCGGL